jgi:hypothetical protein
MTRWFFALLAAAATLGAARAGGPPPVYVVVDTVTLEPTAGAPDRIKISGSFVRLDDVKKYEYGKPVEGYVYLSLPATDAAKARAEWETWRKAAGNGKVVGVGSCGEAGAFLTVSIHKSTEKTAQPDLAYTPGILDRWPERDVQQLEPARALLAFVKARKVASATRP